MNTDILAYDWQTLAYTEAWERQKQYFQQALLHKADKQLVPNYLFLCEHFPVFTLGKGAKVENLLVSQASLEAEGIEIHKIERGGDITFHGLGQCVGYPILDLDNFGLGARQYVWCLEEVIIRLLADYGVQASRLAGATGVWIAGERKICAIGIKCSRMITMHGFAFNVNTDLRYFEYMHPCGIRDKAVTSLAYETGKPIDLPTLKNSLIKHFKGVFVEMAHLQAKQLQTV
jgi:lipoyl(octanoyl) transferase